MSLFDYIGKGEPVRLAGSSWDDVKMPTFADLVAADEERQKNSPKQHPIILSPRDYAWYCLLEYQHRLSYHRASTLRGKLIAAGRAANAGKCPNWMKLAEEVLYWESLTHDFQVTL